MKDARVRDSKYITYYAMVTFEKMELGDGWPWRMSIKELEDFIEKYKLP